jgi:hypothetical protein
MGIFLGVVHGLLHSFVRLPQGFCLLCSQDCLYHAHGRADLRSSALVGQQAGQDFLSNRLFCGIENTVSTALCNAR